MGDSLTLPPPDSDPDSVSDFFHDNRESDEEEPTGWIDGDPLDSDGTLAYEHSLRDTLINAEVLLPQGEKMQNARVKGRHLNHNGQVVGTFDENPFLNSIIYDVEFPDGNIREYAANVIAQNIMATVDINGYSQLHLNEIMSHSSTDAAVNKRDAFVTTKQGRKRPRKTTIGWKILVQWKDDSEEWVPLKVMKENYPVEMAEYAKANGIDDEPAFSWWVPYILRKRDAIIKSVKARVRKTTHKFGIEVPRDINDAI